MEIFVFIVIFPYLFLAASALITLFFVLRANDDEVEEVVAKTVEGLVRLIRVFRTNPELRASVSELIRRKHKDGAAVFDAATRRSEAT